MFPGDPKFISSDEDLKVVFQQMRIAATKDDSVDGYTKTQEDIDKLIEESAKLEYKDFDTPPRGIVYDNNLLSLCMSEDSYHGYNWHLSVSKIETDGLEKVDDNLIKKVLDVFFNEWKEVPNPGVIKQIRHYVGNG